MAKHAETEQRILCAALYAPASSTARVSQHWIEAIVPYLSSKVPLKECSYHGAGGVHLGRGSFSGLQSQLLSDVIQHSVVVVELNCHHQKDEGLSLSAQASALIDMETAYAFVGFPYSPGDSHGEILRYLYSASRSLTQWRYGITYTHSSWRAPCLHAIGMGGELVS